MATTITISKVANSLDWPGDEEELQTVTIQCAGLGFVEYQAAVETEVNGLFLEDDDDEDDQGDNETGDDEDDQGNNYNY